MSKKSLKRYAAQPPTSKTNIYTIGEIAELLNKNVLNSKFVLTKKARTDGSNFRKMITKALYLIPGGGSKSEKGVPKLIAELTDVQLITNGDTRSSFNFQVWNRLPKSDRVLSMTDAKEPIYGYEIRYVFGFHNSGNDLINCIGIFLAEDIEKFLRKKDFQATKTIKEQLIISEKFRNDAIELFKNGKAIVSKDLIEISKLKTTEIMKKIKDEKISFKEAPSKDINLLYSIEDIVDIILPELENFSGSKQRPKVSGQTLERFIIEKLGYPLDCDESLEGFFPDLRNQLLEIKIQESPTIDLGKYSPAVAINIEGMPSYSTRDIRYLILLIDPNGIPQGLACMSGGEIIKDKRLSFVPKTSWKCQNSFSLELFKENLNKVIFCENNKFKCLNKSGIIKEQKDIDKWV